MSIVLGGSARKTSLQVGQDELGHGYCHPHHLLRGVWLEQTRRLGDGPKGVAQGQPERKRWIPGASVPSGGGIFALIARRDSVGRDVRAHIPEREPLQVLSIRLGLRTIIGRSSLVGLLTMASPAVGAAYVVVFRKVRIGFLRSVVRIARLFLLCTSASAFVATNTCRRNVVVVGVIRVDTPPLARTIGSHSEHSSMDELLRRATRMTTCRRAPPCRVMTGATQE